MFAAGALLSTLGYALLWTGVQRFRGDDVTLLESLGFSTPDTTHRAVGTGTKGVTSTVNRIENDTQNGVNVAGGPVAAVATQGAGKTAKKTASLGGLGVIGSGINWLVS